MVNKGYCLLVLILFVLLGCENPGKTEPNIVVVDKEPDSTVTYLFENDTLMQRAELKSISDTTVHFVLTSKNKRNGKLAVIEGLANSVADADPEIDEDEEGNAYPAQEYIFEKGCWLSIRVDMEEMDKLRVIEASCEKVHDKSCPFGSLGILRRK